MCQKLKTVAVEVCAINLIAQSLGNTICFGEGPDSALRMISVRSGIRHLKNHIDNAVKNVLGNPARKSNTHAAVVAFHSMLCNRHRSYPQLVDNSQNAL